MTTGVKVLILLLMTIIVVSLVLTLKPVPQDQAYHVFADDRSFFGVANFANVISNLLFLIVGIKGLMILRRSSAASGFIVIYGILFLGIFLTGLGSAYYHWHPDNNRLVFDRLPMTLVFMSLLSATISEKINLKAGLSLLFPLLLIGTLSVLWWHYTENHGRGDLRIYGLVQFYPMILIPLILILFPSGTNKTADLQLIWVVLWYVLAKFCEVLDKPLFSSLRFISGHSLKHLAAAVATIYLVRLFQKKHGKSDSQN